MLNNKDYCDKDLTAALKELGYPTKMTFIGEQATIEIPINSGLISLYEAQKFLREEKGIFVLLAAPWKTDGGLGWSYFCCNKPITDEDQGVCIASGGFFDSYEEALAEGVQCAVQILKEE